MARANRSRSAKRPSFGLSSRSSTAANCGIPRGRIPARYLGCGAGAAASGNFARSLLARIRYNALSKNLTRSWRLRRRKTERHSRIGFSLSLENLFISLRILSGFACRIGHRP